MPNRRTIRAWKDEDFRLSLSEAERASLPQNPAGPIELSDAELGAVGDGLIHTFIACSVPCYPTLLCTVYPCR
jgi:mersacidin/lichenicidin family type 2 lantibiotic